MKNEKETVKVNLTPEEAALASAILARVQVNLLEDEEGMGWKESYEDWMCHLTDEQYVSLSRARRALELALGRAGYRWAGREAA